MGTVPDSNLSAYWESLPELLKQHVGKYALIHAGEISIYSTHGEATLAGYMRFGRSTEFLIKLVVPPELPANPN